MNRRNTKLSRWSHSLPEDEWTDQVRVCLYRLDHRRNPQFLTTHLLIFFSSATVAADHGGGEYLFVAFHHGRILLRGILAIEGNPI